MRILTSLTITAALVGAAGTAAGNVVPPPQGVIEGRIGARAALPWAKPGANFAVMIDTMNITGSLHDGYSLQSLEETWWARSQPWPDVDILIFFTSDNNPYYAAYYSPLANDIGGLGYGEHLSSQTGSNFPDVFDFSPDSLSGVVVANDYNTYLQQPWFLPIVIGQEIGHRWCCFVREGTGLTSPTELLGRDNSHWSYFLDTGSSPMEGNTWLWDGANGFTTATASVYAAGQGLTPFSQLDLYLLGLLPAADVDPFFVIQNPDTGGQQDLFGSPINRGSPPQYQGAVTVTGTHFEFTIQDIIARNGPRSPSSWDGNLRVAFILLVQPGEEGSSLLRSGMATVVDRSENLWYEATGGRSMLVNVTVPTFGEAGDACDGAAASCGDGLDCVSAGGQSVCAAACEEACAGGCCVATSEGPHCVPPEIGGCVPPTHGLGERCDDGIPCAEGDCWFEPEWEVSYCTGPCGEGCPSGMSCGDDDRCHWDGAPPGATGSPCGDADECDSNLCIGGHCASFCDPAGDDCPTGTECVPTTSEQHVCTLAADGGGGGCTISSRSRDVAAPLALALALALGVAYRRRR